jgi:hypothetical protein
MATYDVGDLVQVTGTYTDADDTATDPDAVFATSKAPDGTLTDYTIGNGLTKDSTGVYYVRISLTAPGSWWCLHYSTGGGQAAGEAEIKVRERQTQ